MEIEDWAASSGGSSDSEATAPDSDNEEHCYAYSDLPKLQFRKDTSKACWKEELGMAEIVSNKGQMWTTTGIVRGGKIYSFLEDILFLAEIGALHLFDDEDKCIPLEDIYKKVAEGVGGSSWESFEVYRHLKSLGYIIKRHGICWSMKCAKSVPASVEGESGSQRIIDNGKEDRSSITDITELFSTMQINEARLVFDVYPPNSKFRKSSPGNPIFVLCIKSCNPPSRKQIEDLEGKCEGIPLKFCYVEHGRTYIYKVANVSKLPGFLWSWLMMRTRFFEGCVDLRTVELADLWSCGKPVTSVELVTGNFGGIVWGTAGRGGLRTQVRMYIS